MTADTTTPVSPLHALVVEDAPALRALVSACLRQAGFEVVALDTGREAVDTARRLHPALISLDVMLPDVCGIELCERLRATEETADIPILVTSARTSPQDRANAELAGADDFLPKPIDPSQFAERARALAGRGRPANT